MPMPLHDPERLAQAIIEVAYLLVIAGLALAVFIRTRRIYALTRHEGILAFRTSVLAFGAAYLFRFIVQGSRLLPFGLLDLDALLPLAFGLATFASTFAILLLTGTVLVKGRHRLVLIATPIASAIVSILVFTTRSYLFFLWFQAALVVAAIVVLWASHRPRGSQSLIRILYSLLFATWVLNALLSLRLVGFNETAELALYTASVLTFGLTYLSVHLRTRHGAQA